MRGQPDFSRYLGGADIGFATPLGIFFGPNLTPEPETGLGRWTIDDIVAALCTGERPDGRELVPIMPWKSYAALSDEDARVLALYLKSLPPVSTPLLGSYGLDEPVPAPYLAPVLPELRDSVRRAC